MNCNKWESQGLLFSADELSDSEKKGYEEHLKSCEFCREQLSYYNLLSKQIIETEALVEKLEHSGINELMSQIKKKNVKYLWSVPLLHFFEKAAIPVILIVAAFFIGKNISQPKETILMAEVIDTTEVDDTLNQNSALNKNSADSSKKFIEGNSVGSIPVSVTE